MGEGSWWILYSFSSIHINIAKYKPIRESSYIASPSKIALKYFVINVKNEQDQRSTAQLSVTQFQSISINKQFSVSQRQLVIFSHLNYSNLLRVCHWYSFNFNQRSTAWLSVSQFQSTSIISHSDSVSQWDVLFQFYIVTFILPLSFSLFQTEAYSSTSVCFNQLISVS